MRAGPRWPRAPTFAATSGLRADRRPRSGASLVFVRCSTLSTPDFVTFERYPEAMPLFSPPREKSVYHIFTDLAQCVQVSAETLAESLALEGEGRSSAFDRLQTHMIDAAELNHRIANRLATSLNTPFQADALHGVAAAMKLCVSEMERTADLTQRLNVGRLPNRLLEILSIIERASELVVQCAWQLDKPQQLSGFDEDMRRLTTHASEHSRTAIAELWDGCANPSDFAATARTREVIAALERVLLAFQNLSRCVDLLRVKDV